MITTAASLIKALKLSSPVAATVACILIYILTTAIDQKSYSSVSFLTSIAIGLSIYAALSIPLLAIIASIEKFKRKKREFSFSCVCLFLTCLAAIYLTVTSNSGMLRIFNYEIALSYSGMRSSPQTE